MIHLILAALIAPVATQPAPAPDQAAVLTQIDALPIDRMCSTRGAFQYAFGSTDLPPSLFPFPGMDKRGLPASAAPFTSVALDSTKWSNRFFRATYEASFPDKPSALAAIRRLAQLFRTRGWIAKEGSANPQGSIILPDPDLGDVHFYSEADGLDPDKRTGVIAALDHLGSVVTFSCASLPLLSAQVEEALGNLPVGTPKPQPPLAPRPESLDPTLCTTPEGQAQVDTNIGGTPDAMTRFIAEHANYHERIVTWKTDRLKKSGKVSDNRLIAIMMGGLGKGGAPANIMKSFDVVTQMLADSETYGKLRNSGDRPGACRAAVTMMGRLKTIEALTAPQWAGMEAAIDAEAKRAGVSLD
jgi:hypothetical protein